MQKRCSKQRIFVKLKSHDAFLLKHFTLRDGNGEVFKGEVQRRDLSAIPDEGVPQAELMKQHAVYLMRYVPPKKTEIHHRATTVRWPQGGRPFGDGFYGIAEWYLARNPPSCSMVARTR